LLQEPSVITNTKKESPTVKSELMLSAGARYNLGKNLSVETSVVRIGRKNSGRINLRVGF
jgi:long-subunit fatty acid transport protein